MTDTTQDWTPPLPGPELVPALANQSVLVIGDLMLDAYLCGDAERISPEAPVPVVRIEDRRHYLGGAGNVARNVAALGGRATLVGLVGKDHAGDLLEKLLHDQGVCPGLVRLAERPTTVKTRILARRQQMLRLDEEDARPVTDQDLDNLLSTLGEHIQGHEIIVISDYNKGLITPAFMNGLNRLCAALPRPPRLLVDPKPVNMPLFGQATLLTPNARETGESVGLPTRTPEEILLAGRRILEKTGCANLLTTLGPDGMALFLGTDQVFHVPTTAREVFDVTGAGDTVIATLALALAANIDILPACVLANYAAGVVVAQVGAAVVRPEELIRTMHERPLPQITRWL